MARYGSRPLEFGAFAGANIDVDPSELPPALLSSALNLVFDGRSLVKRFGRKKAVLVSGGAAVTALHAYYPAGGGSRVLLVHTGAKVSADLNGDGDTADVGETLASGLATAANADFWEHKGTVYFGNGAHPVYSWPGSGAAAAVAALTPPAAAPEPSGRQTVVEDFESAASWSLVGAALTRSDDTALFREGSKSLKLSATGAGAKGSYIHKQWSLGATVDLSRAQYVQVWVYGDKRGASIQLAVKDNSGTLTWDTGVVVKIQEPHKWFPVRIPLGALAPSSRTASTGWAIRFLSDGGRGFNKPCDVWLDDAKIVGGLFPDKYEYYTTYRNSATGQESAPSPAGAVELRSTGDTTAGQAPEPLAFEGVDVPVTASLEAGVDQIRLYRYRHAGEFERARLVQTAANTTATLTDTLDDGELALNAAVGDAPELVTDRDVPPLAVTYAMVGSRLLAGGVTVSGTLHAGRVYVSRFGAPEEFADEELPDGRPTAAGWFDIPGGDTVRRIIPWHGLALIFCDRSVWTLSGSGWDDFNLQQRAQVGLVGREAVATAGREVYFGAEDGVRVLVPSAQLAGEFDSWVISEPYGSAYRRLAGSSMAFGLDELDRLVVSSSTEWLLFDPRINGALARGAQDLRPGWGYHAWGDNGGGPTVYLRLQRGGGDHGQLLHGSPAGYAYWQHRDGSNARINKDDTTTITATASSAVVLAPADRVLALVDVTLTVDPDPLQDPGINPPDYEFSLTAGTEGGTGTVTASSAQDGSAALLGPYRFGAKRPGRRFYWELSDTTNLATRVALQSVEFGIYRQ